MPRYSRYGTPEERAARKARFTPEIETLKRYNEVREQVKEEARAARKEQERQEEKRTVHWLFGTIY